MREGKKIQRTNGQTMTYNTLHRKLKIDNEFEMHTPLYICYIA